METFLQQLQVNGVVVNIVIVKYWARYLMIRMNFMKRKATNKGKNIKCKF